MCKKVLTESPCGDQAARCDCCKVQGNLTESVMWRAEMKHFCDQECLLKFYCQQNEPIMVTQKGPENTSLGTRPSILDPVTVVCVVKPRKSWFPHKVKV